ncbi:MAG: hypothetical protein K8R21_08305, partial [Leptospira sp.]|nr:hypothetical protein [Leptospira sp.]
MTNPESTDGFIVSFIKKFNPYILIALPCVVAEFVGTITAFSGSFLVSKYLLQFPDEQINFSSSVRFIILGVEILYMGSSLIFLWPVFLAHQKKDSATLADRKRARSRVYNFPPFLIISVWSVNTMEHVILYFIKPESIPVGPFLATALIVTLVSAMVVFYSADFLNRFVLIPHYFPDGNIQVTKKKFMFHPSSFDLETLFLSAE